jgi:hypothetical protein
MLVYAYHHAAVFVVAAAVISTAVGIGVAGILQVRQR